MMEEAHPCEAGLSGMLWAVWIGTNAILRPDQTVRSVADRGEPIGLPIAVLGLTKCLCLLWSQVGSQL
jgi:hypothetical protein